MIQFHDLSASYNNFLSVRGESHYIFWFIMVTRVLLMTFFCLFEENYTISFDSIWWPKYFSWHFFVCLRRITLEYVIQFHDLSASYNDFLSVRGESHYIFWFIMVTRVLPMMFNYLFYLSTSYNVFLSVRGELH